MFKEVSIPFPLECPSGSYILTALQPSFTHRNPYELLLLEAGMYEEVTKVEPQVD